MTHFRTARPACIGPHRLPRDPLVPDLVVVGCVLGPPAPGGGDPVDTLLGALEEGLGASAACLVAGRWRRSPRLVLRGRCGQPERLRAALVHADPHLAFDPAEADPPLHFVPLHLDGDRVGFLVVEGGSPTAVARLGLSAEAERQLALAVYAGSGSVVGRRAHTAR